jgi:hypothetical protein
MAMGPRIYTHLKLTNAGKTVEVKGPTGEWEPYAVEATFAVIIAQPDKTNGNLVLAMGRSPQPYTSAQPEWYADAVVFDPNGAAFHAGVAEAWGVASIKMKNDKYETYAWGMTVRLIDQAPFP